MAYAKRGSRPITVDQLNFRWRRHARGELSVWHVLDAGLLRVLPPPEVQWDFDPTPAYVARAIQLARSRGWQTHEHLELPIGHALFAELVGYGPSSRQGSLDELVDRQLELLEIPSLPPPPCLRVTLLPRARPIVVLDLGSDQLQLHGVVGDALVCEQGACDPTWLGDILVEVREADPASSLGPAAGVDLRDPRGELRWRGAIGDPVARVAAHGAWRAAWRALGDAGRAILEDLHPHLDLPEPPWRVVDPNRRVLQLFGVLTAARVPALAEVLASGGWIVDGSRLREVDADARLLLGQERGLGEMWVLPESFDLERPWRRTLGEAESARTLRVRRLLALRAASGFDPRWASRAGEVLTKGGSLEELDRWLSPHWQPAPPPERAVWCSGPALHHTPPAFPWVAMNRRGVFVGLPSGEVRSLSTRYVGKSET